MSNALDNFTILNTRPDETATSLAQEVINLKGKVINFPCIKIVKKDDWLTTSPSFDNIDKAIFTSINAVNNFFTILKQHNIDWPLKIINIAIGKSTRAALEKNQIKVHAIPDEAHSESLITLNLLQNINDENILIITGVGGRTVIFDYLQKNRANIIKIETYLREIPKYSLSHLNKIKSSSIDVIVFTSKESIENIFKIFPENFHKWIITKQCIVISKRQEEIAQTFGFQANLTTYDKIIKTLINLKKGF